MTDDSNTANFETSMRVDLTSKTDRERLSGSALKGFFNITAKWELKDEDARELLGGVSSVTLNEWKKNPDGQIDLGENCIIRTSILVGIYRSLHVVYGNKLADEWVNLPNRNELFTGLTPIQVMVAGGLPAMQAVRELLEARGGHPG